ncbi:MAG: hypothetical protein VXW65_04840 [Pseudomonadota bacterium]|nr:hypothetical protein [Pseudomonadota bacterium]
MVLAMNDVPFKTEFGLLLIRDPQQFQQTQLDICLRRLLIFVDGQTSVAELLAKGLPQIGLRSMEHLLDLGLISYHMPSEVSTAETSVDFVSARFDILDLILDLSLQDFAARPWVEVIEQTTDLETLAHAVGRVMNSDLAKKHPTLAMRLQQQMGWS